MRYKHDPGSNRSLIDNSDYSIYEDRSGIIWIGTYGSGLSRFDREVESFTHYAHQTGNPGSLSDSHVSPIFEDRSVVVWIGTRLGGLSKFDRENETFTPLQT